MKGKFILISSIFWCILQNHVISSDLIAFRHNDAVNQTGRRFQAKQATFGLQIRDNTGLPGYLIFAEDLNESKSELLDVFWENIRNDYAVSQISDACGPLKPKSQVFGKMQKLKSARSVAEERPTPIYADLFDIDTIVNTYSNSPEKINDATVNYIGRTREEMRRQRHQIEVSQVDSDDDNQVDHGKVIIKKSRPNPGEKGFPIAYQVLEDSPILYDFEYDNGFIGGSLLTTAIWNGMIANSPSGGRMTVDSDPSKKRRQNDDKKKDDEKQILISNIQNTFVLIKRGNCSFGQKVLNAQKAGYQGAVVFDPVSDISITMHAEKSDDIDPDDIMIPSVFVGRTISRILIKNYIYDPLAQNNIEKFVSQPFIMLVADDSRIIDYLLPLSLVVLFSLLTIMGFSCMRIIRVWFDNRKNRLTRRKLKKLPKKTFKKDENVENYDTCVICLEDYDDGDSLRILPCNHAYHTSCIDPWLTRNRRNCPLCKRNVLSDDESDISALETGNMTGNLTVTSLDTSTSSDMDMASISNESVSLGETRPLVDSGSSSHLENGMNYSEIQSTSHTINSDDTEGFQIPTNESQIQLLTSTNSEEDLESQPIIPDHNSEEINGGIGDVKCYKIYENKSKISSNKKVPKSTTPIINDFNNSEISGSHDFYSCHSRTISSSDRTSTEISPCEQPLRVSISSSSSSIHSVSSGSTIIDIPDDQNQSSNQGTSQLEENPEFIQDNDEQVLLP